MSIFKLFGSGANQISRNRMFGRLAWFDFSPLVGVGAPAPTIASATTIAPLNQIVFVSGTTAIATITPPPSMVGGGQITLIPTGLWSTNTSGNIALATTATVGKALILTWDASTSKWYPSYYDNIYGIGLGTAVPSSGIGIAFPATQAASSDVNTLDDYEEGTWTPGFAFSGGSVGVTYGSQSGTYTKIGNVVTIQYSVILTAKGSSVGSAQITGLPFAGKTGITQNIPSPFATNITGVTSIGNAITTASSVIQLYNSNLNYSATLADTAIANNSTFSGTIQYFTN